MLYVHMQNFRFWFSGSLGKGWLIQSILKAVDNDTYWRIQEELMKLLSNPFVIWRRTVFNTVLEVECPNHENSEEVSSNTAIVLYCTN